MRSYLNIHDNQNGATNYMLLLKYKLRVTRIINDCIIPNTIEMIFRQLLSYSLPL